MDPFLHTLLQCFRVLRRLSTIIPELAVDTIKRAVEWNGTKPFGPATSLKQYLRQTGWVLALDGLLTGPDYLQCNLLTDSCKFITKTVRLMWNHHLLTQVNRKGVGDFIPDVRLFHAAFSRLDVKDQSILKLNVTGAFQTQAQKAKWTLTAASSAKFVARKIQGNTVSWNVKNWLQCDHNMSVHVSRCLQTDLNGSTFPFQDCLIRLSCLKHFYRQPRNWNRNLHAETMLSSGFSQMVAQDTRNRPWHALLRGPLWRTFQHQMRIKKR